MSYRCIDAISVYDDVLCFSSRSAGLSEPTSPTSLRSASSTEVVCSSPEYAEDAAVPARDSRVNIRAHFLNARLFVP